MTMALPGKKKGALAALMVAELTKKAQPPSGKETPDKSSEDSEEEGEGTDPGVGAAEELLEVMGLDEVDAEEFYAAFKDLVASCKG